MEPLPPLAQVAEEVELRLLNLVRQDLGGVRDVLLQRLVVAVPPFEVINISFIIVVFKGTIHEGQPQQFEVLTTFSPHLELICSTTGI